MSEPKHSVGQWVYSVSMGDICRVARVVCHRGRYIYQLMDCNGKLCTHSFFEEDTIEPATLVAEVEPTSWPTLPAPDEPASDERRLYTARPGSVGDPHCLACRMNCPGQPALERHPHSLACTQNASANRVGF